MSLSASARKLSLTAHVVLSVGWLGAVAASLALGLVGVIGTDRQVVQGVYIGLEALGWYVLVPLSFGSLLSGVVQSLGTRWGLFRHYWVIAKLVMNVLATTILLLYMQTLTRLADLARARGTSLEDLQDLSPVLHSVGALLLLVAATALSIYKPTGLTRRGQRSVRPSA